MELEARGVNDHGPTSGEARLAALAGTAAAGRPPGDTVAIALAPEDLMVVVAGGPGKHSAFVPTFGATRSVTVRVEAP